MDGDRQMISNQITGSSLRLRLQLKCVTISLHLAEESETRILNYAIIVDRCNIVPISHQIIVDEIVNRRL